MAIIENNENNKTDLKTEKFKKSDQECEYCGNIYTPTRRFVQKYCSKSCRVMASTHPEYKIANKRRMEKLNNKEEELQEVSDKQNDIAKQQDLIRNVVYEAFDKKFNEIKNLNKELIRKFDFFEKIIKLRLSTIRTQQEYHMAISLIVPFIAEPLRQRFIQMANSKNSPKTYEEFVKNVEPYLKTVSPEIREQLIIGAKSFYNFGGKG